MSDTLSGLLRSRDDFQDRLFSLETEEPFAENYYKRSQWGKVIGSHLALPGLRGFWPGGAVGPGAAFATAGGLIDQSGLQNHMTPIGTPVFNSSGLLPYIEYDGASDYHQITDANSNNGFDILGNEGNIGTNGLTIGGLFYNVTGLPLTTPRLFSKGTTAGNDRTYGLAGSSASGALFYISSNGTDFLSTAPAVAFPIGEWVSLIGRFTPSSEVKVYQNGGTEATLTTGVPATINNAAGALTVAAQSDGTRPVNIRCSMLFVCATALSDNTVSDLVEQIRVFLG